MLYELHLKAIMNHMQDAVVQHIHTCIGEQVGSGTKLLDLKIDLGSAFAQECPPISYHRIILRESAWLRQVHIQVGDQVEVGSLLATFSARVDDDLTQSPAREIRTNGAAIVQPTENWGTIPR